LFKNYKYLAMNKSISFNFSSLIGIIILLVFGYFLFSVAKIFYIIFLYATPLLLIAILIMKKELLFSYFKKIGTNIKLSPLVGILNGIVSLLFLPFTLVGMMFKILISKKIENLQKDQNTGTQASISNEFIEYEDLSLEERPERKTVDNWKIDSWEDRKK